MNRCQLDIGASEHSVCLRKHALFSEEHTTAEKRPRGKAINLAPVLKRLHFHAGPPALLPICLSNRPFHELEGVCFVFSDGIGFFFLFACVSCRRSTESHVGIEKFPVLFGRWPRRGHLA